MILPSHQPLFRIHRGICLLKTFFAGTYVFEQTRIKKWHENTAIAETIMISSLTHY